MSLWHCFFYSMAMIFVFLHQVCRYRGGCDRRCWFVSTTSEAWPSQGNVYRLCLLRLVSNRVVHGYWGKDAVHVLHVKRVHLISLYSLSKVNEWLNAKFFDRFIPDTRTYEQLTSSLCTWFITLMVIRALMSQPVYYFQSSRQTDRQTKLQKKKKQAS